MHQQTRRPVGWSPHAAAPAAERIPLLFQRLDLTLSRCATTVLSKARGGVPGPRVEAVEPVPFVIDIFLDLLAHQVLPIKLYAVYCAASHGLVAAARAAELN